jgi:EAL domain-containing protein (putative c-di-GMP-specific phosphodiesterase class I)
MTLESVTDKAQAQPGEASPLDHAADSRDMATLSMVHEAIRRREVLLAYQPVMQSQQPKRVAFHEGLIRVLDDTGRIIPARDFIRVTETSESGRVLDCLSLEMGLRTLAEQPDLRLSINMSGRSIGYPRWIDTLRRGLDLDPTIAERLILEISERSAMVMPDIVGHFMQAWQRKGVSFALDDFGAGFISLRYLRGFTFDAIKIDGQFIRGVHADVDNQCLVRSLLSIAEHFDMFTVAESVETAEDAGFLAELGVDCQQGYFYGAPTTMPEWRKEATHQRRA